MFYYLHLTRPPPERASPYQPLLITPDIANDLRTEFPSLGAEGGIDIFYAWVKCIESDAQKKRTLGPMTQPQKLMTWSGNSYKEAQVFPPKEAALRTGSDASRWSLLLCTRSSSSGKPCITSVDLSAGDFGNHIFPILSAPIHFVSGSRAGTGRSNNQKLESVTERRNTKQIRNERVFKLPSPLFNSASVGPLRVTEQLSYDLDKKVWDSGVGLSNWLVSTMLEASRIDSDEFADGIPSIVKSLMRTKGATILELGTGTGLVSIVLATLLGHCPEQPQSKTIATDLPSAMELLELNISDNVAHWNTSSSIPAKSAILDWDEEDEEKQFPTEIQESGVDFIIMADVTYNTASFPSLIRTLSRLSTRARRTPSMLLAYKERDPDERRLWDMARGIELHLHEIGRVPGAGGVPVEIYQGRFEW